MNKIAITMGDPSGVGPEIIVSLLSNLNNDQLNELVIIGNVEILNQANNLLGNRIDFKKINSHLEIIDVKSKFIEEVKPKKFLEVVEKQHIDVLKKLFRWDSIMKLVPL